MNIDHNLLISILQALVIITYLGLSYMFYLGYQAITYKMMEGQDAHLQRMPLPWWMRAVLVIGALGSPIFLVSVIVSIF